MEKELRAVTGHIPAIETRADGKDYFVGVAIVYNQLSQLLGGWFKEQIVPAALDEADMSNVCGLFNHDEDTILGRTLAGTLILENTPTELRYAIPVDMSDPDHVRVRAKILRGDVRGSSFAFMIAPGGADWDTDPQTGVEIRTVKKIAILADVSPVVNPAYLQTSAGLGKRSLDAAKQEYDTFVAEHRQKAVTEPIAPVTETAHDPESVRSKKTKCSAEEDDDEEEPMEGESPEVDHDLMCMELD